MLHIPLCSHFCSGRKVGRTALIASASMNTGAELIAHAVAAGDYLKRLAGSELFDRVWKKHDEKLVGLLSDAELTFDDAGELTTQISEWPIPEQAKHKLLTAVADAICDDIAECNTGQYAMTAPASPYSPATPAKRKKAAAVAKRKKAAAVAKRKQAAAVAKRKQAAVLEEENNLRAQLATSVATIAMLREENMRLQCVCSNLRHQLQQPGP